MDYDVLGPRSDPKLASFRENSAKLKARVEARTPKKTERAVCITRAWFPRESESPDAEPETNQPAGTLIFFERSDWSDGEVRMIVHGILNIVNGERGIGGSWAE